MVNNKWQMTKANDKPNEEQIKLYINRRSILEFANFHDE